MAKVLIVDDEESICWGLERMCVSLGHSAFVCSTAEDGLESASNEKPDLILLDVRLPGMDGLNAMSRFQAICPETPIIVMTAYGELNSAVAAIKNGAWEYLPKPFDGERVKGVIERAINEQQTEPNEPLAEKESRPLGDLVGSCASMQEVFRRIAFAATSDASVLIQGESGTGKELAARAIHRYSKRSDHPFVAVNVAALSPTLAESELFGHVKSSFTGADADRSGLLVQASGGTLFLDEIAEIPLSLQVKLLRCLDQGEVLPVGANETVPVDIRVIAATHQDIPTAVSKGEFRHDLFFRICAFQIELPPLRERREDILELAGFFIDKLHQSETSPPPRIAPEATKEILSRTWTGNVRELRNAIEHALILSRGNEISAEHLPDPSIVQGPATTTAESDSLPIRIGRLLRTWTEERLQKFQSDETEDDQLYEEFLQLLEPAFLSTVMKHYDHQYVAASKVLGIHRTTLKKKLTDHGIDK